MSDLRAIAISLVVFCHTAITFYMGQRSGYWRGYKDGYGVGYEYGFWRRGKLKDGDAE